MTIAQWTNPDGSKPSTYIMYTKAKTQLSFSNTDKVIGSEVVVRLSFYINSRKVLIRKSCRHSPSVFKTLHRFLLIFFAWFSQKALPFFLVATHTTVPS